MATIPSGSHNTQGALIARALVERGHAVSWYSGPGFRSKIEATGARYLPLDAGLDFEDSTINEQFPDRQRYSGLRQMKWDIKHVVFDASIGYTRDIVEIEARDNFDLILGDVGAPAPVFASELTGLPCALYGPIPLMLRSRDTAPFGTALPPGTGPIFRLRNLLMNGVVSRLIMHDVQRHANRVRASLGLAELTSFAFDALVERCDLFLQCTTPAFEYPRSDLPEHVHFIGPLLPAATQDFSPPHWWSDLESEVPVVHVTQGTVETNAENLILPTIRGLAEEDVLIVATTGGQPVKEIGLERRPDNLRAERFVPHAQLLRHVDVMVSNGGYGGTQMALSHGVPLVVSGHTEDKPEVCARVAWSGAGIRLKDNPVKPERLRRAVRTVLKDPAYRSAAARIKAEFEAYDAPLRAVELLEGLAA